MPKAKLLLIDDEAALLRLMQTYLGRLDYDVQACSDAAEGLRLVSADDNQFELAIVDLSLIESNQSLINLADAKPSLRILICSGRPFETASLPAALQPRFDFLQKPFLPNMLAAAVNDLLKRAIGD